jgi:hypothetical protein
MLERRVGRGRVVAIYTSPDRDCTTWPMEASWPVLLLELNRHLAAAAESVVEPK